MSNSSSYVITDFITFITFMLFSQIKTTQKTPSSYDFVKLKEKKPFFAWFLPLPPHYNGGLCFFLYLSEDKPLLGELKLCGGVIFITTHPLFHFFRNNQPNVNTSILADILKFTKKVL